MTKIIFILSISFFGSILTLISDLINKSYKILPNLNIWVIFSISVLFCFLIWKLKFKKFGVFNFFLLKRYILYKKFMKSLDSKINGNEGSKVTELQDKSIKLWKLSLRDKRSSLSCSIISHTRQIEKDNLLIILQYLNEYDFLMSIIDTEYNRNSIYEIRLSHKLSEEIIQSFDQEIQKRMKLSEELRRNSIKGDLDNLINRSEALLQNKKNYKFSLEKV